MISWNKIIENAIGTLVTGIIVGAGIIIWNGVMSIDKRIADGTKNLELQANSLEQQANYMDKAVKLLQKEMIELRKENTQIAKAINQLREDVKNIVPINVGVSPRIVPRAIPKEDFIQKMLPNLKRQMAR